MTFLISILYKYDRRGGDREWGTRKKEKGNILDTRRKVRIYKNKNKINWDNEGRCDI